MGRYVDNMHSTTAVTCHDEWHETMHAHPVVINILSFHFKRKIASLCLGLCVTQVDVSCSYYTY
jgi:hypothetical protein